MLVGTNGNSQRAADNRSRNKAVHNILPVCSANRLSSGAHVAGGNEALRVIALKNGDGQFSIRRRSLLEQELTNPVSAD